MYFSVRVPATNDRGPQHIDQAPAAICAGNGARAPSTLAIASNGPHVALCGCCPMSLQTLFVQQVYAHYPDADIEAHPAAPWQTMEGELAWSSAVELESFVYPIKRYPEFIDQASRTLVDPLAAMGEAAGQLLARGVRSAVLIHVRPTTESIRELAIDCLRHTSNGKRLRTRLADKCLRLALTWSRRKQLAAFLLRRLALAHGDEAYAHLPASRHHDHESSLAAADDKLHRPLFEAAIEIHVSAPHLARTDAANAIEQLAAPLGQFSAPARATFHVQSVRPALRRRPARLPVFLLSAEELATLWHPPLASVRAPALATVPSREFPPPVELPTRERNPETAVLGHVAFRYDRRRFGILPQDRLRHVALLGKTGMGKSSLLLQLALSDIRFGRGIALVDPHGDLADALLAAIPASRTNDVIVIDPTDSSRPVALNLLAHRHPSDRPLVASAVVAVFKKLYADSWGPRLEYWLRNSVLALLEIPDATILSILRLLAEPDYRADVTSRLTDPVIRHAWTREFATMPSRLQAEVASPIQNKIGQLASSPLLRAIVGQPKSTIDLRRAIDEQRIVVAALSKGRVGDDAAQLLGAMLVTQIQLAAMSRAELPETERTPWFAYVDEFHNYATDSFATAFSELRKFGVGLTVANQHLAQLDDTTRHALFGNVGTLVAFQVGANDAELVATQLGGDVSPQDLMNLPRYQACVRLLIDGMPSRPFTIRTTRPRHIENATRLDVVRRTSGHRYGRPLNKVKADIDFTFPSRG